MNRKTSIITLYILVAAVFYLLPFLIRDTGSAMVILLTVTPLLILILSAIYSRLDGFKWYFSVIVGILFVPAIYLHYNESAWIYTYAYLGVSFLGQGIGFLFRKK